MKTIQTIASIATSAFLLASCAIDGHDRGSAQQDPVDYVNPYMGNVSHLLVPTYPTVHLPNSMLRVYPERGDFTGDLLGGLPVIVTSHRGSSAFNLSPWQGEEAALQSVINYSYDQEKILPYRYQVYLDDAGIEVDFAPSHQSAVYSFAFDKVTPAYLVFNSRSGELKSEGNAISGYQFVDKNTKVYLYAQTDKMPTQCGVLADSTVKYGEKTVTGTNAALVLAFGKDIKTLGVRYGISFISEEQAKKNLEREIAAYDVDVVAKVARNDWNDALGKIQVKGGTQDEKTVFYTSLYRCYERPVNLSEDGRYYSAFDGKIHEDGGRPFYTDDWIWDTYRATHPLRVLMESETEGNIINSYLLMAEQMGNNWMPTFPEVTGDSRRMNSNHAVATVIDAYRKGLRDFDLGKAYLACKAGIEEKTLIPWSAAPAGWLDAFYKEHGYIPALKPGEKETVPNVSIWEKRQPI
ncbi:MAG: GH92 family glycosyl hydrolase, partial [Tannerellaceae bacterium]